MDADAVENIASYLLREGHVADEVEGLQAALRILAAVEPLGSGEATANSSDW